MVQYDYDNKKNLKDSEWNKWKMKKNLNKIKSWSIYEFIQAWEEHINQYSLSDKIRNVFKLEDYIIYDNFLKPD